MQVKGGSRVADGRGGVGKGWVAKRDDGASKCVITMSVSWNWIISGHNKIMVDKKAENIMKRFSPISHPPPPALYCLASTSVISFLPSLSRIFFSYFYSFSISFPCILITFSSLFSSLVLPSITTHTSLKCIWCMSIFLLILKKLCILAFGNVFISFSFIIALYKFDFTILLFFYFWSFFFFYLNRSICVIVIFLRWKKLNNKLNCMFILHIFYV